MILYAIKNLQTNDLVDLNYALYSNANHDYTYDGEQMSYNEPNLGIELDNELGTIFFTTNLVFAEKMLERLPLNNNKGFKIIGLKMEEIEV
jgi:hypothetical protein